MKKPNLKLMGFALPDPETARKHRWRYQVCYHEDGQPCFYRFIYAEAARSRFKITSDQGLSPFVIDVFTGDTVNIMELEE